MSAEVQENIDSGEQTKRPKKSSHLYDIEANNDGSFDVAMPGFYDLKTGHIVGTSLLQFETREEAETAIEASRKDWQERYERISLEKSYTKHFYRIDADEEGGQFVVTFPGLKDLGTGHYVGTSKKVFPSWEQAKEFYLRMLEDDSSLTKDPIVELQVSDSEQIAFSDFDNFRPNVAPAKEAREIPPAIQKYILKRDKIAGESLGAATYQKTIIEDGWEDKIFAFVSSYLEREGQKIAEELGIKHLDSLSPRQAAELATRIVVEFTKYKHSDVIETTGTQHLDPKRETKADQSSALTLLEEGLLNRGNQAWEGNGVCRNFASMTKAVFEALKAKQTKYNRLRDTYCLYDTATKTHEPRREDRDVLKSATPGHAWNTFVSISETKANATIVDTTWAKRDLDTGNIEGLDYTLTRMEPIINKIAFDIPPDAPNRGEQIKHVLSYYLLKMERLSQSKLEAASVDSLHPGQRTYYISAAREKFGQVLDLNNFNDDELARMGLQIGVEAKHKKISDEENLFFSTRIVHMLSKEDTVPEIPPALLDIIGERYKDLGSKADMSEIETLWKIFQANPYFKFAEVLKAYLDGLQMDDYHCHDFISYNDELQVMIYENIKANPKFDLFLKDAREFASRIKKVLPGLFIDSLQNK
ncbi:MAG: hypothetical protein WCV71_01745 [Patescibacteria group bacterium]